MRVYVVMGRHSGAVKVDAVFETLADARTRINYPHDARAWIVVAEFVPADTYDSAETMYAPAEEA